MSTTLIFRLSDEQDQLDAAADRPDRLADAPPGPSTDAPPTSVATAAAQRPWWRSEEPVVEADVARDPESVQRSAAGRGWDSEPGEDDQTLGRLWLEDDGDESVAWSADGSPPAAGWGLNQSGARASSRSLARRVISIGAIVGVALLVLAAIHGGRHAGRGSAGQRPLVAAAASATNRASLPASAASPRSGRWPIAPRSPAALRSEPRDHRPQPHPARHPARRSRAAARAIHHSLRRARRTHAPAPTLPASAPDPARAVGPIAPAPSPAATGEVPQPARSVPPSSSNQTSAEFSFER
jgi:hypothetical protein